MDLHPPPKPAIILPRRRELIRPDRPRFHLAEPWRAMLLGGLGVTSMCGGGGSASDPPTIGYQGFGETQTDTESPSITSVPLGTDLPTRRIIAFVNVPAHQNAGRITSTTLGGIAGTKIYDLGGTFNTKQFWIYNVTGTTATWAGSCPGSQSFYTYIAVWAVYGLASETPVDSGNGTTADPSVATVTTTPGGFVLASAHKSSITADTCTWTNLTNRANVFTSGNITCSNADASNIAGASLGIQADYPANCTAYYLSMR